MVTYFAIEAAPGRMFFRCEPNRATLSREACAGMWREGHQQGVDARATCRLCPIGAEHAGEGQASMSVLKGSMTCGRCHQPSRRLIQGHVCVSCKNREYEFLKGRNAKGTAPVKLRSLEPRRIWFMAGPVIAHLELPRTIDRAELIVAALRDTPERVRFSFRPAPLALGQARLF